MAVTSLLLLLILSFSSPCLSHHHHSTPAASATLDVSAALAMASSAVSDQPSFTLQEAKADRRDRHRTQHLSFLLHPRASLLKTHKDYKNLTISRLHRDADRVEALNAVLQLALSGVSKSDLKPQEETQLTLEAAMEGPVISGTHQGSGEYFSKVGIGKPAKSLYMVLDTGSDVTWVQCQPCSDCYQQADPIYDPSASTTYSPLPCDSQQCRSLDVSACRNSSCLYQVSYGDGSYTVGDFAMETVSFGADEQQSSVPNVAFGCGHDNEGLFVGAAGLLGLGGGSLSFPSQVSASSFSYCLVDRDSAASSTLDFAVNSSSGGEIAAASATADAVTAPLLRNKKLDTFYYVGLSGLSVGGRVLAIPDSAFAMDESGNGGVIVDSGTAVTRLQPDAYAALRDAFKAGTRGLPAAAGVALFDTCYDLSGRTTVEVPTVGMHFPEGRELRLPAKNYLIPVDSAGTFCFAFAPTSSTGALSIIGNVQQQGTRVSFDLENDRVGFAANKC